MFIREKKVKGVVYRSLVESHRDGGRVRQKVLYTLGRDRKTIAECVAFERRYLDRMRVAGRTAEAIEQQERLIAQLEQWERTKVSDSPGFDPGDPGASSIN